MTATTFSVARARELLKAWDECPDHSLAEFRPGEAMDQLQAALAVIEETRELCDYIRQFAVDYGCRSKAEALLAKIKE